MSVAAGNDLDTMLSAQQLTASDLEVNRAGRVSEGQAARVEARRKALRIIGLVPSSALVVAAVVYALYDHHEHQRASIFILPAVAAVFALGIFALFFFVLQLPSVANARVIPVEGPIGGFVGVPSGGGYVVAIHHVQYKGVATGLTPALMAKGRNIRAYVVPETKMVVAVEPVE